MSKLVWEADVEGFHVSVTRNEGNGVNTVYAKRAEKLRVDLRWQRLNNQQSSVSFGELHTSRGG